MASAASLTELIRKMQEGDRDAAGSLFAQAASRLRTISQAMMARDAATAGFSASDLLQEAFTKNVMALDHRMRVNGSDHFFAIVTNGMRQILTDRARARQTKKRQFPAWQEWRARFEPIPRHGDLTRAMQKLKLYDGQAHRIVQLKNDYGMTWEEVAVAMGLSVKKVRAEFDHAVYWLRREIR